MIEPNEQQNEHPIENASPMLKSFLSNQKYTDKEADEIEKGINNIKQENYNKAINQLFEEKQSISEIINAPTKNIKIEEETEEHDFFKGYDHSLEKVRNKNIESDIEFGNLGPGDLK